MFAVLVKKPDHYKVICVGDKGLCIEAYMDAFNNGSHVRRFIDVGYVVGERIPDLRHII